MDARAQRNTTTTTDEPEGGDWIGDTVTIINNNTQSFVLSPSATRRAETGDDVGAGRGKTY